VSKANGCEWRNLPGTEEITIIMVIQHATAANNRFSTIKQIKTAGNNTQIYDKYIHGHANYSAAQ
jgi:hypothetical protein